MDSIVFSRFLILSLASSPIRSLAQAATRCLPALAVFGALSVSAQTPANVTNPATIAVLLPGTDSPLSNAADAVRRGILAANAASGAPATIQMIDLSAGADPIAALGAAATLGATVAIGPLSRTDVGLLAQQPYLPLPVVALNIPSTAVGLPEALVLMGLPAEDEARRVVRIALAEFAGKLPGPSVAPRFLVVEADAPLEHRIAQAYVDALAAAGERSTRLVVQTDKLESLRRQAESGKYEAVFLALDARAAALVRPRLPREAFVFATALANPGNIKTSADAATLAQDLDGLRFVDAPWLIEPDHPALAGVARAKLPLPADEERLYALGIDAYRVALEWSLGRPRFEIEGATGHLVLDRLRSARVERTPFSAVLRNGEIERENFAH
ncbi:MAG: penicillin-binding protein activator [Burkholderiaceae bacterium]